MKRLLALVVAVGMVVGAFVVRARIDDDEGESQDASTASARLVCTEELGPVCAGLGAEVEPAAQTFDRLVAEDDPEIGGWIAPASWPAMVDVARLRDGRRPLFSPDAPVLARSRIVAVGPRDAEGCGWRCLGDRVEGAGLRLGVPPHDSAIGLVVLGAAAAGYFDRGDIATNDFDPAFDRWFGALAARSMEQASPVRRLLLERASFEAALSTEADAAAELAAAAPDRSEGLVVTYPEPVATVDVVLAGRGDAGAARAAFAAAGWAPADGGDDGLPNAGVLLALRDRLG